MLEVEGVGGAYPVGEVEKGFDSESRGRGLGEHLGDPIVEAVAVAEVPDDGIRLRTRRHFGPAMMRRRVEEEQQ